MTRIEAERLNWRLSPAISPIWSALLLKSSKAGLRDAAWRSHFTRSAPGASRLRPYCTGFGDLLDNAIKYSPDDQRSRSAPTGKAMRSKLQLPTTALAFRLRIWSVYSINFYRVQRPGKHQRYRSGLSICRGDCLKPMGAHPRENHAGGAHVSWSICRSTDLMTDATLAYCCG